MNLPTLTQYGPLLWSALTVLIIATIVWTLAVRRRMMQLEERFNELFADSSSPSVTQMLADCLHSTRATAAVVDRLQSRQREVDAIVPSVIRHVGLVRFSPFHDTGGDQSFALALLDGEGDGVVVTALHSRSDSRLYAKPVEHNGSTYSLTPEEREAIARATSRPAAPVGS